MPQSVEAALKLTGGTLDIKFNDIIQNYSQNLGCLECGTSYDKLEPRDFSFNSPFGACNTCNGLGINYEIDEKLLIKNRELTFDRYPEILILGGGGYGAKAIPAFSCLDPVARVAVGSAKVGTGSYVDCP